MFVLSYYVIFFDFFEIIIYLIGKAFNHPVYPLIQI